MTQELEQKVTALEAQVNTALNIAQNVMNALFEERERVSMLERKLDAILAPQVAAYAQGLQFGDIKQALDPLLPTFDGKKTCAEVAQAAGLGTSPADLVRIGRYLKAAGVKRGRNSNERYYWFIRQKNIPVTSDTFSDIDLPY